MYAAFSSLIVFDATKKSLRGSGYKSSFTHTNTFPTNQLIMSAVKRNRFEYSQNLKLLFVSSEGIFSLDRRVVRMKASRFCGPQTFDAASVASLTVLSTPVCGMTTSETKTCHQGPHWQYIGDRLEINEPREGAQLRPL